MLKLSRGLERTPLQHEECTLVPGRRSVLQRVDKRAERWEWSSKRVERLRRIECVIHELKAVTRLEALSRVP